MDEVTVKLQIYSPRWGHEDTYSLEMSKDSITISLGPRSTTATYKENLDPEWAGEPLVHILQNDSIYPPEVFQRMIEYAWLSWRNGELSDQQVDEELQEAAKWLNLITKAKPSTDFWNKYF